MLTRSRNALAASLIVASAAAPLAAEAHPHVWIDAQLEIRLENGAARELVVTWLFDEIFSFALIEDFDVDYNNLFGPQEIATLHDKAFISTAEWSYFTHVRNRETPLPAPEAFEAWIEDDRVGYKFRIPLQTEQPGAFGVGVYDDTFYVDVALDEFDPVMLTGPGSEKCLYQVVDDVENPIYFDLVIPKRVDVSCRD